MLARIRWMNKTDIDDALLIESMSFNDLWDNDNFKLCIKTDEVICLVAENDFDEIVGYLIYKANKGKSTILRMAVHPFHRKMGVGSLLLSKVLTKKDQTHVVLREHNVNAQMFFKGHEFKCFKTLHKCYGDEDGYKMGFINKSKHPKAFG